MPREAQQLHMLDTDTASYVINGRNPAVDAQLRALNPANVCISAVTRAELLYGLARIPASHRLHLVVKDFLRNVSVLSWDAEAADWYAIIRAQLERDGHPIGERDVMIAAHAISARALLVTNDTRHFNRIKDVPISLVNWA